MESRYAILSFMTRFLLSYSQKTLLVVTVIREPNSVERTAPLPLWIVAAFILESICPEFCEEKKVRNNG